MTIGEATRVVIVAAVLTLTLVSLASAVAATSDATGRAYAGARLIYAIPDFDIDLGALGAEAKLGAENAFGLGLLGGWQFPPWAALELELHFVPDLPLVRTKPSDADIGDAWILTLIPALRVFPLSEVLPEQVSASALFGVGALLTEGTLTFGMRDRTAMAATLALHFAGTFEVRLLRNVFLSFDGGYVLAPDPLRVNGFRLTPNFALVGAGLTLYFGDEEPPVP